MKMPVDVVAVLKAAADIEGAASTPLAISVYIDESAPGDLIAHVRSAFASASPQARVRIDYFDEGALVVRAADDMAVLVAGSSSRAGEHAVSLRAAGVPAMVVTADADAVEHAAVESGFPVPKGDIVSSGDGDLDERMGEWVIAACREKKLAIALAFPFARKPLALDSVRATSMQNAAVGAILFIPGADMPIMTLNQAKMLLHIAAAYGKPMTAERVKELAFVVGGAFACRTVARQAVGVVPGLGWAVKAAIGYVGTEAMGRAAIEYFEAGGDAAGLANVVRKARDGAVNAAQKAAQTPAGKKTVEVAREASAHAIEAVRSRKQ